MSDYDDYDYEDDNDFEHDSGGFYGGSDIEDYDDPYLDEQVYETGRNHAGHVGTGGHVVATIGNRYMDSRDRALSEFRVSFKDCTNNTVDVSTVEDKIRYDPNLENMNME